MSTKKSAQPGPAPSDPDSTPERIRRAGIALFREYGYHGTAVRALADAVGLEPASLYHHFESKQALLADLFDRIMDEIAEGLRQTLESDASHEQRLRDAIRFHVLYHVECQDETFISRSELRSLAEENRERIQAKRDRYEHMFRDFLQSGVEAGEFQIDDVGLMSTTILVMCSGVSDWYADHGRLSGERIADEYCEIGLALTRRRSRSHSAGTSADEGTRADARGSRSHRGSPARSAGQPGGFPMRWA